MKTNCDAVMFVCVECGADNAHLCEQISPSVLKLSQCEACDGVVDRYIEYDGVLVLLDMLLLKTPVYRHIVFNRRSVQNINIDLHHYRFAVKFDQETIAQILSEFHIYI